jgi:hypothetical protein
VFQKYNKGMKKRISCWKEKNFSKKSKRLLTGGRVVVEMRKMNRVKKHR